MPEPLGACVEDLVRQPKIEGAAAKDLQPVEGGFFVSDLGMAAIEAAHRGCLVRQRQSEALRAVACEHGRDQLRILLATVDRERERAWLALEDRDHLRVERNVALVGGAALVPLAVVLAALAAGGGL